MDVMDVMDVQQENTLEKSLRLAANEPAHRPEFFRTLLNSTVYVLGTAGAEEGTVNLEAGSKIRILHWEKQDGTPAIPFFSSLEILQQSIDAEQSYLELPAKSLLEMTLGTNLFLNPKSPYGKEFTPEEVQHLLSEGIGRKAIQRTVPKETKVLLGQPEKYPSEMVDSLTQLLAKHHNVKRAFLALMHDASVDEKPHLVVGIEADGDIELVLREAGNVAGDTAPDDEPVDLCLVSEGEAGLSNYFLTQTKPFCSGLLIPDTDLGENPRRERGV
ncbi:enhanced serine sensitivity protein SseB [Pseudomonas zhanjiangensis]|uniref:Enhanced serine sensitivity protein SseB n=1 Tax=Pseudomonas zhanjiangensis TaxID=3239015 RepID=A0ABV3YXJ3_9PSED